MCNYSVLGKKMQFIKMCNYSVLGKKMQFMIEWASGFFAWPRFFPVFFLDK
jgi:hypothetical protein